MRQCTQRELPIYIVTLIIGTLVAGCAWSSQANDPSDRGLRNSQFEPTAHYSGVAEVGTTVHEWISSMVRSDASYEIPYTITLSGDLARAGFSGPEEIALLAMPQRPGGSLESGSGAWKENTWNPVDYIPSPSEPGTPGSVNGGTQCYTGFGSTFPAANIEYEWTWMQTDTNNNGQIDAGDQWGWHLTSFSVEFLAENISIDPESCNYS